jgi:16S rRNA (guanine527-N7)-methyltransferase
VKPMPDSGRSPSLTLVELWTRDPDAAQKLRDYRNLILEWNRRFNLTAVRDPEGIDARLIGDSLRLAPEIDAFVAGLPGGRHSAVDIGSGAGIPAIPLAIVRPDIEFTLIEATGKKASFLARAAYELGLDCLNVIHSRSEDVAHNREYRERFDLGTARAVTSLPALAELILPFLRVGGRAILPKGEDIAGELRRGEIAARLLGGRVRLTLPLIPIPGLPVTRVAILDKIEATSSRYPRRAGIPEHEPLGE